MRVVVTELMDESALVELRSAADVLYDPTLVGDSERLARLMPGVDGLIVRNQTQVSESLLMLAHRLKVVGRLGVGLDNIDTNYCQQAGIKVIPAVGANAISVAEYVVSAALLLTRRCFFSTDAVRAGKWPRTALSSGEEIAGKMLGIVGFGSIGRQVASLAQGVGMLVSAFDSVIDPGAEVWGQCGVTSTSLAALVQSADVVSLHVPLLPATRHLFGAKLLGQMKPSAVLVNTSRGGIVDERAVAAALRQGKLAGAALDVYESEPLGAASYFDGINNLILTPHVAGVTRESNRRISQMIAHAVLEHLSGCHQK